MTSEFDLDRFLPYMLNQAAEAISREFQERYRVEFDLSRTQWRIIANLGKFGSLTAKEICQRSHEEKTTVSRAVATLEERGLLVRTADALDRRSETLNLTAAGKALFVELGTRATTFDLDLRKKLGKDASAELESILRSLAAAIL
jgi:DNA-binding MarR family transcriptional regulator